MPASRRSTSTSSRAGLPAQIVLPAFKQRHLPRIEGRVRQVSADAIVDPQTGERYFEARIEVDRAQLAALAPDLELTPGMPAEVYITTGERTMLDYLLQPVLRQPAPRLSRALTSARSVPPRQDRDRRRDRDLPTSSALRSTT